MKRRDFIAISAITSALILAGGLVELAESKTDKHRHNNNNHKDAHRMAGGQCGDYRMMENGPDARFGREIFGI